MTLKELKQKHGDIISDQSPSIDDLKQAANGKALFYASLRPGTKPKDDRLVLWAGPVLTAGTLDDPSGEYLFILRLTAGGNARTDAFKLDETGPDGNAALFYMNPYPSWDPRNRKPWEDWDKS